MYTYICTICVGTIFDAFCLLSRKSVSVIFIYMYQVFLTGTFNQVSTYCRVDKLLSPATFNENQLLLILFGCTGLDHEAIFNIYSGTPNKISTCGRRYYMSLQNI